MLSCFHFVPNKLCCFKSLLNIGKCQLLNYGCKTAIQVSNDVCKSHARMLVETLKIEFATMAQTLHHFFH